jgi:serine/threonine protein kinase
MDLFAIKVMDKAHMVEKNMTDFVQIERNILTEIDSEFLVRGFWSFQTEKYLYLVMEYMRGGDFSTQLRKFQVFNNEVTKFVMAHVVAGLEALHKNGLIHRDLKPENMLLTHDGHIKLTDFGLADDAKALKNKQKRVLGTADYIAPEMITTLETTFLVDYWAVGIITFECLTGM